MIWDLKIYVIVDDIVSFNLIAASHAVFYLSALSCVLVFVVISGATMLIVELAACASAIDCLLTLLLFMATLDL